jgi:chromosome partition protein MukE
MNELTTDPPEAAADAAPELASAPAEPPARVSSFRQLEDVIQDESFPEVDLALRRGRHIHKGDERWYEFLLDAQGLLEPFYRRYGCELEQRSDGYFFLLPVTDNLGKRHLGVPEMIVGQGLALCYLDPRSVQSGGVVTREEVLNQLASVMGTDALMRTLNPKRKRVDERVMQRTVRQKVNEALRRLGQLGFVELLDGEQLRLAPSLMRFAEPVRGLDAPSEALKRLIERGEVSLGPGDAEPEEAGGEHATDDEAEDAGGADADGTDADGADAGEDSPEEEAGDSLAAFLSPDGAEAAAPDEAALPDDTALPDEADAALPDHAAPLDGADADPPNDTADTDEVYADAAHVSDTDAEPPPAAPAPEPIELDWDTFPGEKA